MNFSKKSGKKKAAAAAVICFVAAIAITGTYTFNDYKKSQNEKELAMADEMDFTEEKYTVKSEEEMMEKAVDGEVFSNKVGTLADIGDMESETGTEDETDEKSKTDDLAEMAGVTGENSSVESVSALNAVSVNFSEKSLMLWPVSGTILMDYSMDKTVYFKTLEQYKYNPALIIAAARNDLVIAGVSGIVKSIDNSAETGMTVNVDLGNGYEVLYGQLHNIAVATGDYVEATTTLGYVAEPTKYYSSEGSNVYLEMRKDGQPIDPKAYLTD